MGHNHYSDFGTQDVLDVPNIIGGRKYLTSERTADLADAGTLAIWYQNPAGSSEDHVVKVGFAGHGAGQATLATDVAQDGTGETTTQVSANQSGTAATAVTRTADAYTINGDTLDSVLPGGDAGGFSAGTGAGISGASIVVVQPGDTWLFRVANQSGSANDFSVGLSWFELPE